VLSKSKLLITGTLTGVSSSVSSPPLASLVAVVDGAATVVEADVAAEEIRVLVATKLEKAEIAAVLIPLDDDELDAADALELDVQTLLELLQVLLEDGACQVLVELLVVGATQTEVEVVVGACQVDVVCGQEFR
jgi:hypothetical protein